MTILRNKISFYLEIFKFRKSQVSFSAHIFALRHLDEMDVICSCICFIELLGVDSDNLRLHLTVAALVQKKLNFSIGKLIFYYI